MKHQIISEDFEITASVRQEVESLIPNIAPYFQEDTHLSVFLSLENEHHQERFKVLLKAHMKGKDIVGTATHVEFPAAVHKARTHLIRQAQERRQKRVHQRRKPA